VLTPCATLDAFSRKLKETLLLTTQTSILELTGDDLGIDSLVATTIRSWFSTELGIDLPVMKLLTGSTMKSILDYALKQCPAKQSHETEILITSNYSTPHDCSAESTAEEVSSSDFTTEVGSSIIRPETESSEENAVLSATMLPLSSAQLRFWFLQSMLEDKTTSNVSCLLSLRGPLSVNKLEKAVRTVAQRHEALRTCFIQKNGRVRQAVMSEAVLRLETKDVASEAEVPTEFQKMDKHVFDLESGETMRILLLVISPTSHFLIVSYHHINMDGVSFLVLIKDLASCYSGERLSEPLLQYPAFCEQQHEELGCARSQQQLAYWRDEYSHLPPPLSILPLSEVTTRKPMTFYDCHNATTRIDRALRERVQRVCLEQKVTMFHFLVTIFQTLLARLSGEEDLCMGIPDAGRKDSEAFQSIGNFINILPLRLRTRLACSFAESLQETCSKTCAAMSNADVPIDVLLTELGVERNARHMPLFQCFIDYRNVQERQNFGDCEIEGQQYSVGRTGYDVSLDVIDDMTGNSTVTVMVQKSLYTKHAAEVILKSYMKLMAAFAEDPLLPLQSPSLYDPMDIQDSLVLGRGECPYSNSFMHSCPHNWY
jgi:hybrid polyketide synthase / nonribosomal peptide synthetase ACE1